MPSRTLSRRVFAVVAVVALVALVALPAIGPELASAQTPPHPDPATSRIRIPESVQAEHEAIARELARAIELPGAVGAAARELAAVLEPHFQREEEIALPPLGLLAPLAAGQTPPEAAEALAMSDALRSELPRMLAEHQRIRAAVDRLRTVARAEDAVAAVELADELALHARTEEEVLYPAAVLVGELIRARRTPGI
jgi:hypothetical protein